MIFRGKDKIIYVDNYDKEWNDIPHHHTTCSDKWHIQRTCWLLPKPGCSGVSADNIVKWNAVFTKRKRNSNHGWRNHIWIIERKLKLHSHTRCKARLSIFIIIQHSHVHLIHPITCMMTTCIETFRDEEETTSFWCVNIKNYLCDSKLQKEKKE